MSTPTQPAATTSDPRRLPISRPRSIFLATVVLVVVAVGLRFGIQIYRQQVAIREIERLGGFMRVTQNYYWVSPLWVYQFQRRTRFCVDVWEVDLTSSDVREADMAWLKWLPTLQRLDLSFTQVGDGALPDLSALKSLQCLDLATTNVTDVGLVHLKRLPTLRWLNLCGTHVSESGVADLKRALPDLTVDF
jgi:hypothetical protein